MDKRERKSIAHNRSARHEYEILETFECGVVLTGTEVKSLRDRGAQITDAFCLVRGREVWLHGVHIHPYSNGGVWNVDPDRKRQKGLALIPLDLLFDTHNRVKLVIGLARGKKLYDKRADAARRDSDREIQRALKERSRF